jgi:isopenicillin-N epimerase
MSGFFLATHPLVVREAIDRHRSALDASPLFYVEDNLANFESAVRQNAANYWGCSPDDLAMTDSTTMGLGITYTGLKLQPSQEILTTEHDHFATSNSLRFATERSGAILRLISLYGSGPDATESEMLESILKNVNERTRVIAITWVHSSTGVKIPVR